MLGAAQICSHFLGVVGGYVELTLAADRVRLPRTGLSVAEDGGAVPVHQGPHHGLDARPVHLVLAGRRSEGVVEGEEPVGVHQHLRAAGNHLDTLAVVMKTFCGEQRADTDRHLDVHLGHDGLEKCDVLIQITTKKTSVYEQYQSEKLF